MALKGAEEDLEQSCSDDDDESLDESGDANDDGNGKSQSSCRFFCTPSAR